MRVEWNAKLAVFFFKATITFTIVISVTISNAWINPLGQYAYT